MKIDPPAIVQSEFQANVAAAKSAFAAYESFGRKSIEAAIQTGELLLTLKRECGHGKWLPTLASIGINYRTASRLIAMAEGSKLDNLSNLDLAHQALIADIDPQTELTVPETVTADTDESTTDTGGGETQAEDAHSPSLDDPAQKVHYCRQCRMLVNKPEKCKKCNAERKAMEPATTDKTATTTKTTAGAVDAAGLPIPPHVAPAFDTARELKELCREHDRLIKRVEEISNMPGGRLIRLNSYQQQMRDAKGNLAANKPTHLCPYCKAEPDKPCECCSGDGWVAKYIYQQAPGNHK